MSGSPVLYILTKCLAYGEVFDQRYNRQDYNARTHVRDHLKESNCGPVVRRDAKLREIEIR